MYELEVKLCVESADRALDVLTSKGFRFYGPVTQHDRIFAKDAMDILTPSPGANIMRVRIEGPVATLNLKRMRSNELDCEEFETEIKSPDACIDIVLRLGYSEVVQVLKQRWKASGEGIQVCVDIVEDLGNFVEIERLFEEAPADGEQERLSDLLQTWLGLPSTVVEAGYDRLRLSRSCGEEC